MAAGELNAPLVAVDAGDVRTRGLGRRVSAPVPQPTSSARSQPAGMASKITRW
jgi:hypothetical protein